MDLRSRSWTGYVRAVVGGARTTSLALALALVVLLGRSGAAVEIEQLWAANLDMIMEGAAVVVDLDGDGDAEILTAAYEHIIAVDGDGKQLWRFDTRGRYMTYPAVLERGDTGPLIYAGDNQGLLTCLDGAGHVVWQADVAAIMHAAPALADLNGDGAVEIIQGDTSGTLTVFDAHAGKRVWQTKVEGICASPAVGDLDHDGDPEIVIATGAGKVFAVDATGKIVWERAVGGSTPDWATSSPVMFGNSQGRTCVAAATARNKLFCLDGQGRVLWERPTRGAIASALSVGDLDADGRADLFAVTQLGVLYRFDEEGRVLWEIDTQGRSLAPGAIIDMDGDGMLEYVLCTQRGNLLVFNHAGEIRYNHQFEHRTINVTPAFGDIVKEREGLEFAVTGGESGQILCFATSAPASTLAQWRAYRSDTRSTGAWFALARPHGTRMTPENLSWDRLFAGEDITFVIENEACAEAPLNVEAACVRPDGARQAAVGKVVGRRGLLKMPVSVTAPGTYRFAWGVTDRSGTRLISGQRDVTLDPYRNDRALAQRAVLALRKVVDESPAPAAGRDFGRAILREARGIEAEATALAALQAVVPGAALAVAEGVDIRTAALNARAKRALTLANVARSVFANAPGSKVVAFEGSVWENREVDRQLPQAVAVPLRIRRRCVTGEHEPVSVKLLNVTSATAMVGGHVETAPDGPAVKLHAVKPVPTNQQTIAWDPIVPLGDGEMAIPSLETREMWLDADLANVKPGTHTVKLFVETGKSPMEVAIELEVLPFDMAGFGAMRLCCWASYNDGAVKDLLAHGNNVFVGGLPPATVGTRAEANVDIDFAALDTFVAPLAGHDVFLLLGGIPALGVPMEDDAYVPRLATYLDQVMAHLAARGIDESRVALYPHDEPGGHGWDTVNHFIAFARQGFKARPGLKFYVNGGGDLAMFEALNEIAAIWCPSFYMLAEDTPVMRFLRRSGKLLWSYDCAYCYARPIGANTKSINVVGQYRLAAVGALHFRATGIGYWCYNVGPSMWEAIQDEYPLVYTNPDGTHTSCRRWEAVREGMEDARILIALRDRLADKSVDATVEARIRHLLEDTLPDIAGQTLSEVRLGMARYVLDASSNDATVERLRREMMDCVALLAK